MMLCDDSVSNAGLHAHGSFLTIRVSTWVQTAWSASIPHDSAGLVSSAIVIALWQVSYKSIWIIIVPIE